MYARSAPLKDGNGKELRRLHDVLQQHLRALKSMDHEPFITSMIELKLDQSTMFEWQKFTQKSTDVPHYDELLEFLNLRAQACETCTSDTKSTPRSDAHPNKKSQSNKPVASFAVSTSESVLGCILCKPEKHPFICLSSFQGATSRQDGVDDPRQRSVYELSQAWSFLQTVWQ